MNFFSGFLIASLFASGLAVAPPAEKLPDPKPDCSRAAGTRPFPKRAIKSSPFCSQIEHIVVLMQENHSFDNYFGRLAYDGYDGEVDGVEKAMFNLDSKGEAVYAFHETDGKTEDPEHSWRAMHQVWNGGKNDQFAKLNGDYAMAYFQRSDLPFLYELANRFSIGDRYFCSALAPTFPNRYFLYAGTAFGHTHNDQPENESGWTQKTIFDLLSENGISWKYYTDGPGYLTLFHPMFLAHPDNRASIEDFTNDNEEGTLPSVTFLESNWVKGEDEHPPAAISKGQKFVSERVKEVLNGKNWKSSSIFLMYDESGGYFDHVAPPAACTPDEIPPSAEDATPEEAYDRLGFRVPFVAVSPYVKRHHVSHVVYDHTSVLKFIETRFNLPALTRRDANAEGFNEIFDCKHPDFSVPALP